MITGAGGVAIGTVCDEPPLQPLVAVTETLSDTEPLAPALKVMLGVPWPVAIVPPVTVQVYVAPLKTVALAATPAVFGQTDDGTEIATLSGVQVTTAAGEKSDVPSLGVVHAESL